MTDILDLDGWKLTTSFPWLKERGRRGSICAPTATADSTRKKLCAINQIPQLNPLSQNYMTEKARAAIAKATGEQP